MAQDNRSADDAFAGTGFESLADSELARTIEEHDEELAELLELLVVVQDLSADLAPELREASHDSREPIRELRLAIEREEMLVLVQRVGENADTLVELLETLEVVDALAQDLAPEFQATVRENRETLERLRFALEREETLLLLERLGENVDTIVELFDLLEVVTDLAEDLIPEAVDVARENRAPIAELRLILAGASSTYAQADLEPHQLGQNLGNMLVLGCRLGDEGLIDSVEAGLTAFTDEEPPKRVGILGLLGALWDDDVRQGLGVLIEFLRRMGAEKAN